MPVLDDAFARHGHDKLNIGGVRHKDLSASVYEILDDRVDVVEAIVPASQPVAAREVYGLGTGFRVSDRGRQSRPL